MRNTALLLCLMASAACAAPALIHELSYAAIQDPRSSTIVTVGEASYAVLTFDVMDRGLGGCLLNTVCDDAQEIITMTEVFALGAAAMFAFRPEDEAHAARIARSVRCMDAPDTPLDADFVGVGVEDFGAWQFFGLCPDD